MNSKQISLFSTYRRVSGFFKKNASLSVTIPVLNSVLTSFEANLIEIAACGNQQGTDIRGLRAQKETIRQRTGKKVLDLGRRLEAYGKITGDEVLTQKIHYTESDLFRVSDYEFNSASTIIYNTALELDRAKVAEYGISDELLLDVQASMDEFRTVMDAPKSGYTERKQATSHLSDVFDDQAAQIGKIDALMELVRTTNPAIYAEYLDVRKVSYRSGSLTLKCDVADAATGSALPGAQVVFKLGDEVVLQKTTSDAGGLTIKTLADGTYTVEISRLGYVPKTQTVNVLNVEMTAIKVSLVKSE